MRSAIHAAICIAVLQMTVRVQAETIYRAVGTGGEVTFTDKVPAGANKVTTLGTEGRPISTSSSAGDALPFELRQLVAKFPVTLYSSSICAPCDSGRVLLGKRGIPFVEKTVNTPEDAETLRRISGGSSLPFLTVGGQHIKGFSDAEWTQFLNAAEYPQTSILPTSYRNPEATPLVTLQKLLPDGKPIETGNRIQAIEPSPTPTNTNSNPAGIQF